MFLRTATASFTLALVKNVALRVQQQNAGLTPSTRARGPWKLAWQSDVLSFGMLELDLKRQKGGNGFYQKTGLRKL
jgi:hypothetical protein